MHVADVEPEALPGGGAGSAIDHDPRRLGPGQNLDTLVGEPLAQAFSQLVGVERGLGHAEDRLDEFIVEELADVGARGLHVGADAPAELLELARRDVGLPPADRVILLEIGTDRLLELGQEPRRVDARAKCREHAARIVVAAMDARLVVVRRPAHEVRLLLDNQNARAAEPLGQPQRGEAAVGSAADDDVMVIHRDRSADRRRPRAAKLPHLPPELRDAGQIEPRQVHQPGG